MNVYPSERRPVALMFLFSFLLGIARIIVYTAAYTFLLTALGADTIPYLFIGSGILIPLVTLLYTKLGQRLTFAQLLIFNVAFSLALFIIFYILLSQLDASWPILAFAIWMEMMWAMSTIAFWALAGQLFDVRQGKRLFGLISSGDVLAAVLGGLLTPTLIDLLGTRNFLLPGIVGMMGALLLLIFITRTYANVFDERQSEHTATLQTQKVAVSELSTAAAAAKQRWWRKRYILLIFALMAASVIGYVLLENTFYTLAEQQFVDENALASFLGLYFGAMGFVTLIARVWLAGAFLNRYGVRFGAIALPLSMAVLALIAAVTGSIAVGLLFWMVAALQLVDALTRDAIEQTTLQTLYQPLPTQQQEQTLTTVNGVLEPAVTGLTGLILLLLNTFLNVTPLQLIYLLALVSLPWLVVGVILGWREYPAALRTALTRRRLSEADIALQDASTITILDQALQDSDAGVVIYALNKLEEAAADSFAPRLSALLAHPSPVVQLDVLARLERLAPPAAATAVQTFLAQHPDASSKLRGAALRALAATSEDGALENLAPYLEGNDAALQADVLVGLLRYGGIEGVVYAGHRLVEMTQAAAPQERQLAAQVLGEIGNRDFYRALLPLLTDPDLGVRQAALQAAGLIGNPRLWPLVIENLPLPAVRGAAVAALIAGGDSVWPALRHALTSCDIAQQRLLASIAGRIGGPAAIQLLLPYLHEADVALRSQVLAALSQCHYQAQRAEVEAVQQQLKTEVAQAVWLLAALETLPAETELILLQRALLRQLQQGRLRLFALLSFLYDSATILKIQNSYLYASAAKRAYALEALDVLLSPTQRDMVLPLLTDLEPAVVLAQLSAAFTPPTFDLSACLQDLVSSNGRFDTWTQACALYASGRLQLTALADCVTTTLTHAAPLVREMAVWAAAQLALAPAQLAPKRYSTVERVALLRHIPLFAQTPDDIVAEVAQVAAVTTFVAGEQFIEQGENGDSLYIIIEGEVDILIDQRWATKRVVNDVLGEMAVLESTPRSASCIAAQDTTTLKINRPDFATLMREHPALGQGVIKVLVHKLGEATQRALATQAAHEEQLTTAVSRL